MKNLLIVMFGLFLLSACQKKEDFSYKTVEWYKSHPDILKKDVETCEGISLKNQENWCAVADQADRERISQRILDEAHKTYY